MVIINMKKKRGSTEVQQAATATSAAATGTAGLAVDRWHRVRNTSPATTTRAHESCHDWCGPWDGGAGADGERKRRSAEGGAARAKDPEDENGLVFEDPFEGTHARERRGFTKGDEDTLARSWSIL